ncbi:AAA family ATPase SEC18 [Sugiyamaella lignohabitans]|uniref:Vesicular-fusion protein SEC18 n=1 Tax=Sugiyamaella lignohabitans TaxID=796027 RepID=A0A167FBF1_9ASCO|nr:AAA family ATPase SEC18 [Sugiyamaella lignohabitans]ANB15066.1 AAA family ATPase SEC18 [Sugiyamaella lignohabitans]
MEKFGFGRSHPGISSRRPAPAPQSPVHATLRASVENAPAQSFVIDNVLAVPAAPFKDGQYVIVDDTYVFTARVAPNLPPNVIGAGGAQREWANWSLRQDVTVKGFDIFASGNGRVYLGELSLEIDFYSRARAVPTQFDQDQLAKRFLSLYKNQIFAPGQKLAMEFSQSNFKIKVLSTQVVDLGTRGAINATDSDHSSILKADERGILVDHTEITFSKPQGGLINIKASGSRPRVNAILQPNFKFSDTGIGGLDEQFSTIFRRAFASRIFPPADIEKLNIQHVKGLLLYGPPGTGKTLIARQIGKMLNSVEPKIVNGPEMLSKYVGSSEENIRNLFKDAEAEYKEKGDESQLHIIIFDELDAVFKQRGSRGDGTGVGDNVVNQLLAKMDGVEQLNNILVIGMTNRRDLIDSALLRPGRFEVQLEIPLPDEHGRKQIFTIHTAKMAKEKMLGPDVSLEELASKTKNFTGAEIQGLIRSAVSFALDSHVKTDSDKIKVDNTDIKVTRVHFMRALDEITPALGVSEDGLSANVLGGIIKFSPYIETILSKGSRLLEQVREAGNKSPVTSVLVHGPPGSGKTALASHMALQSGFKTIRLISPSAMGGMTEAEKIRYLKEMFQESYKSEVNVLVIDNIEAMLDWVNIGPRFSNGVLQTLKVCLTDRPPNSRRLIVFLTTSNYAVLERMDFPNVIDDQIYVPNISSLEDLRHIFEQTNFLDSPSHEQIIKRIQTETNSSVLGLGIKKVLFNLWGAKVTGKGQEIDDFVERTVDAINSRPGVSVPQF